MEIKKDYIRVTEMLKPWMNWGTIPQEVIDAKADIGTNVHEAINMHALGLPLPKLTEREQKYFESYLKWEEAEEPTFLCAEQRYYDDEAMVTGQIDAIVSFPGRTQGRILDFKTSFKPSPLHWPIQLGWYYQLAKKNGAKVTETGMMLQLKDNGSPAKPYTYDITPELIKNCWAIYHSYIYFNPIKKCNSEDHNAWCC